ncbi:MAG: hypothetical protein AAGK97_07360 [Bacteroidota bacterium]
MGFLPNFFAGIAIHLTLSANNIGSTQLHKYLSNNLARALIVFFLLFLGEVFQKYTGKVFDYYDLLASAVGVLISYFVVRFLSK